MSLVTREGKGSKLTIAEMDGNLTYLESIGRPYKVYTALLTQEGENAPVATVLENTLDEDITYQYNGAGNYSILTPNNTFTANKTYSVLQLWADDGVSPRLGFIGWASTNELYITLTDTNGNTADTLGNNQNPVYFLTSIEIRVYN
jgi:hypothetical protein